MTAAHPPRYAAIYARVSTEDQGKNFSIPTQMEGCQKLAEHEGYTVPETHIFIDDGVSGVTLDRPAFHHDRRGTTSPFHPDLGVYLRRFGVTTPILTGYSTTGVLEGTLRDARDQDYDCVVVRDGCAAAMTQEHETCMDLVFPRMAWVASVDDVINAIRG